jgi:hypothetical protein
LTTDIATFIPGFTVRYIDNGIRSAVVKEISPRRSGGNWVHVIIEDGRVKKFSDTELTLGNDERMKRVMAMTPAEQEAASAEYLAVAMNRAAVTRALMADDKDETKTETPQRRGRVAVPVNNDAVSTFINVVKDKKVATKSDVVSILGEIKASEWNKIVKAALATGEIESHGVRRGTKYTVPGFKVEKVAPKDDVKVQEYAKIVFDAMTVTDGPVARAHILSTYPTDNATYQAAMKFLVTEGKVVKTGAKRGTRYHVA